MTPSPIRNVMRALENAVSDTSPQRGEARSALRPRSGARQAGRGEKHAWEPTPVPPALLQTARDLRQHMTDAEQCLWQCLRGKQLDGSAFASSTLSHASHWISIAP